MNGLEPDELLDRLNNQIPASKQAKCGQDDMNEQKLQGIINVKILNLS